jgi:hypothetical protein
MFQYDVLRDLVRTNDIDATLRHANRINDLSEYDIHLLFYPDIPDKMREIIFIWEYIISLFYPDIPDKMREIIYSHINNISVRLSVKQYFEEQLTYVKAKAGDIDYCLNSKAYQECLRGAYESNNQVLIDYALSKGAIINTAELTSCLYGQQYDLFLQVV